MDENTIADFKQFMTATISQQVADIKEDISRLDKKLTKKMNTLSNSVAEALDASNEVITMQLKDHERRITKLEHRAA
jgi:uncharacterized coiled-coil protein SlyX